MMLLAGDLFFMALHLGVIFVNLCGWAWRPLVRLQRWMLGVTLLSWFGAGAAYGWGYCFLTDWQWRIKEQRGETDLPASFITYLLRIATGEDHSRALADSLVVAAILFGLAGAIWRFSKDSR
jgi:hypothetical protein